MLKTFLVKLYGEVGLPPEQAERVADETRLRMLRRERPPGEGATKRSLIDFLVRDPLVSLNRIIGRGDVGLPFYDEETRRLSLVAFGNVMSDAGIDPVVAMAYAKVVVEAYEPEDLYRPVWIGLGRQGGVDLEELRTMDWSPLRAELGVGEATATAITTVHESQPRNRPAPRPQQQSRLKPPQPLPKKKP